MDKDKIESLRAAARGALGGGPWWTDDELRNRAPNIDTGDRRWIEAASPETVLALLDALEAGKGKRSRKEPTR